MINVPAPECKFSILSGFGLYPAKSCLSHQLVNETKILLYFDSPGAKYFFEDLLHPLVRKIFLHLKEATLHLQ